ncbi:SDR family oxidoreductase [Consotaella aegiceratis]|uniref:SDR family oxidoreductase n=1 Tax=Consotaella aegiceratis TaxID=3097961 RepID=UPI002F416C76
MHLTGNTILITGGTSGIGRALAEAFHDLGNRVVIAGRRQNLLDDIIAARPGMRGIALDVTEPSCIDAFATRIREEVPDLNVLINNAGISRAEDIAGDDTDLAVPRAIVQTNILGVLHLTASLLPILKRQPSATIVTTSSGLAFVPQTGYPTYCASKAFLHSWLQSLRMQLAGTAIEVLELAPPYVQTELLGPGQASDPHAMPLAGYIAEVMQILETKSTPQGEILVERVKALRHAERTGTYEEAFALLNGPNSH